jgi:hypothetical protein
VIPTMIVFGLLFGRWWRATLLIGTVGWVVLLLVSGTMESDPRNLAVSAGLAFANTAVGVAVHQVVLFAVRRLRQPQKARTPGS